MTDKDDAVEPGAISVMDVFKDDEPEIETVKESTPEPESKGEPEEQPEPEAEAKAEPEAKEEPQTAEPPSAEPLSVPKQALLDERRKRQALEAELASLRKQSGQKDENAPDPLEDPEGYEKYLRSKWESERFTEVTNKSRERMLETHVDYEDMEKHFVTLAQTDPSLVQKLRDHPEPARFAYETAKESKSKLYADVEKQVIERLRKEGKLKEPKSVASEVATLINSPGAGKNNNQVVKEITDIKDIFRAG